MSTPTLLKELLSAAGPSGYEQAPAAVWRQAASKFAEVHSDTLGSSMARVAGTDSGPLLTLVGHIDEIGLIVTHIDDDGYLYFTEVGGWDTQILVGQRIEIATANGVVPGVVGKKPIHLLNPEERKQVAQFKDLHIDVGAKDGDDARDMVRIGDVAVITGGPLDFPNGRIVSRALDNRVGAYVVLRAAELVAEVGGGVGDVVAVAAVQEETTLTGSATSAFSLQPDVSIVVDVTFETKAPGVDVKEQGKHEFGSGPVVGRGSNLNPRIFELLAETAKAEGIEYTVAASARHTGTDADVIHRSRGGVPTGLVSVPLRYMHSPVEMVQADDVENAARLIAGFARRLAVDTSFLR